ncbi:RiPP maturation radical SAM C-methyltransferase [Burkholderia ubonensis]|uniref:RiPP maturation radical SAM C-methyltransferase n=1 Tax=Burkholderia ubonensis TaxID=101571 RepID=UPI00075DAA49|nr:RiPP maturation radical SAM C-methyltransferase [Burkholderia ubonensis]KVS39949.1 bacteriocin maturation radical SAM protein 1 [Burkholderia ubonensis]KVS48045.1 bacteriocin maturation radical SAM protein 1 [Burkholderia ubonensis]KVS78778.1 bacteriocin maturation radical SAM protein 1 [Burkholderia ubonensis]KVS93421.1 bacteriocin maturation radical SAM protein 1 [Burkholderia ubonensis]KVS94166.1 bacteriocin maturation radical SAM protein 1 [Burkholderia ubonensis]
MDVLLVSAPVMSIVRPSAALGLLQASLAQRGICVSSLYLNLIFAQWIGVDLNERLADGLPSHLLIGDWFFARELHAGAESRFDEAYEQARRSALEARGLGHLDTLRDQYAHEYVRFAAGRIVELAPRVVGFTTMFEQTAASLAIAGVVKAARPDTIVCFGGATCHGPMGATLHEHYRQIDYVFTGEADQTFAPFVEALLNGDAPPDSAGWVGRTHRGRAAATPTRDLDSLPIPDYRDYFVQLSTLPEHDRVRPSIPFESSRGCWWGAKHHCTFCGLNAEGLGFREKSPKRVQEELETLAQRHEIARIAATDNILSRNHVETVLTTMAGGTRKFRLFYEIKSNFDEERLRVLAKAGVTWVQPGIENLSDPILRLMRKGVDRLLNVRLLRNCRELGMGAIWSILYGFPDEPASEYDAAAEMVPLLEHLQPPVGCGRIRLDRFSPNYEYADRIGFRSVRPMRAYSAIYQIPEDDLSKLAYFFEGDAPASAREDDLVKLRDAVQKWRARWFDEPQPPALRCIEAGDGYLIEDTRSVAVSPLHYAGGAEVAVLDRCRSPCSIRDLEGLTASLSANDVESALASLLYRGFVLRQGHRILALPVMAGREEIDADDRADLPFGYLV